jgi:hypothetical protein
MAKHKEVSFVAGDGCPIPDGFEACRGGNSHVVFPTKKASMKTTKALLGILTITAALVAQVQAQTNCYGLD